MNITMLVVCSMATSLFVAFCCWRNRPRPWLKSAANALQVATAFWLVNFAVFVVFFKRTQIEWASGWFACSFLLSLACPVTAFSLARFNALYPTPKPEGVGISPTSDQ